LERAVYPASVVADRDGVELQAAVDVHSDHTIGGDASDLG
jgi:hypothetical protein